MFPITISDSLKRKELHFLENFMLTQPQYYPNFEFWVKNKCLPNIKAKGYQCIAVVGNGNEVIGNAIFCAQKDGTTKIKNLRIDRDYTNRDLGRFLIKQVAYITKGSELVLDVTSDNFQAVEFFIRNGFHIVKKAKLYLPYQDEFIMTSNPKSALFSSSD